MVSTFTYYMMMIESHLGFPPCSLYSPPAFLHSSGLKSNLLHHRQVPHLIYMLASWHRALALKRQKALLLYEYSRDAAGLPVPGTQRRFKLNANPRQIGQESIGLGVYLTSIIMYMIIMLLLTLLSIYLVVNNTQQRGYTDTYTSYVNDVSFLAAANACCCPCMLCQ